MQATYKNECAHTLKNGGRSMEVKNLHMGNQLKTEEECHAVIQE